MDIKLKGKDTSINIKLNTLENRNKESESDVVAEVSNRKKGAYVYHMISIFDLMRIRK